MIECLSCRRLDQWPRFAVATALMLFACFPASLMALPLPGVSWSSVYEFTSGSFLDESGNANTLSAITGSPGFAVGRNGASSSAIQGSAGTILGRTSPLVSFNPSSNQLTLSAWIKSTSSGNELIATMGRSPSSIEGEWLWGISNGRLYFWDYQEGGHGFPATFTSTTTINNGQWRHVAFVRNGLTGIFYIDGIPAGSMTAAKNISYTNSDMMIGGDYRDKTLSSYWTGQLDDVSVSSGALTAAQILLLAADASVPGVETGPTNSISGLTQTSVKLMGGITNLGGKTVTNAGFYLNTNSPATNGVKYSAPGTSFGLGSFSNTITGLTPGTSYYYRAFAANSVGTGYGANEYSFTTPSPSPFTYTNNGTGLTITGYTGTGGNVEIPATIGGFPVTKIGDNAFSFRTTLTNITIPDSVLEIGQNAFYGCSGLQTALIGNGVTTLPRNAFSECVGLTSVSLGASVKTLGDYVFNNCKKLTSITFPAGFESMGTRAFALCAELTSITFPQSVTAIGSEAFYGCTKLSTVYFQGNTPPTIEWGVFSGIADGAMGYYPTTASTAWGGVTIAGLSLVHPDTESPVITLSGANPLEVFKGATFTDLGATVTDNVDATRTITGSGTVNTANVGIYTLNYTTTDAAGNLALPVTRTVNVVLNPAGDEDGDGLTNGAEMSGETNPYQKDSDNDGVNDFKEVADGTNPTDANSYNSLSQGLVAYYPFSGNANDSSGNGNNGIPVSPVLSADRLGAANAAYSFNGTTDRINLSNSAALNMNDGVPFSMSAWIKTDFSDGQRVILGKAAGALGNTPALFVDNEGKLRFDNFEVSEVHSNTTVRTGNWMHVAVTYDGSTYRLYVNGVADGERAFTGSNESGNSWTFSIGGSLNTSFPSGMFKGSIDEVQFWSRTLSPTEVAGVVQASSAPANRAPVIAGQSTTYDALAEFVAGPTQQSANSRWQYLGGNVSALALLGNWKTTGNEIIQNQSQWDGNSGYLSNYPFVQRVNSASGPTSANTLVIHPSNMEEANRAVAIGWKNTSGQTVAANFNVNLRLPYGSANGIDYKLQRGLAGASRYLSIRSGSLQAGGSVALASDALLEMQAGEMLYLIVDSKNNFDYDHTEVSAFTVTVAGGANLDSISQGVASASNSGTAVTVLTEGSSDADSDALKGVAVTGVDTSHGDWEYTVDGGNIWNSLNGVSLNSARLLKSDELHRVRFVPNANFSGNAEIRYQAWDQTSGEDGALADLTAVGGGAWVLVAYGANASLGGFLTAPSGSFSSSARTGSAVLPGSLDILKNSMELAMTWTASGGSVPSGGIGSYAHGIAFALPNAAGMSFDGSATSPLIYNNGANPLNSSFAVGSSNPDQSLVNVRTLVGSPGMPSQMYLRNKTFGAGYGSVYGVVMNNGSNAQLDYNQMPDSQTFKAVYLDHGTGAAQGQGLVMGGSGGASNSYVPSTMALWARLDPLQVLALNGGNPVSTSGNYLLDGISTTYVDVIDFDASGAFSAETATGTIHVNSSEAERDFTFDLNTGSITGYNGPGGAVEIPAAIGGLPVTTIGQNAFQSKTNVTSVVIPNGVTTILDAAFAGCSSMTAITLPNSLTSIGGYVFDGCSSLQSITIPDGVTSIGPNAFAFCTSLPSITLPSGLNKIMSGTFWTCTNLTSITIPSSVNEIQYNAFLNCSKLASVNFLGNTPPKFGSPTPFGGIAAGAKGYYPATASAEWGLVNQIGGLTIVHPDTQSPVITLIGANPLEVFKGTTFSDPGATVTDNRDVTRSITGTGTVNTATVGIYTLNYSATDAAGNLALPVTRTVNVVLDSATITMSSASGSYTLLQGAVPLDDSLTVSGGGTFSGATIQIETGFAAGDTLNLTLSIGGITGTYDGTKGILTLSGSAGASVYQAALRAVTFSTTSTSTVARGFKVTLGSAISFGGHYYEFVPGSHSWAGARTLALSKTFNGLSGYLANLTSADENSFVKTKIGTDVWIGGSDEGTEGVWKWMDGPEAGITFWNGLSGGSAPSGRYANWNSGEPNDAGNEDYAQFFVNTGKWNDLPSGSRLGFLVEYGTDTSAIQTFSGTRIFSVTKAMPTITVAPTAAPISYGQTLGASTLSGGSASVSGTFAFTTPSTAPSVGMASQSVTFTPTQTANYNTVTTTVNVIVSRANPTVNPGLSASAIAFGQTLADSSLSGSASLNGTEVGGTFAFTTPSAAPNSGTASQNVTFTPTETANYNTVTTNVSVTVSRATPTINLGLSASAIIFGQTLANSSLSGSASVNGTVVAGTFAFTTPSTAPNAGTAGQGVTFTPIDRANYNTVTASVSVTVNQALISSGFSHTLYLATGASKVSAWGMNTDGRLGVGDMDSPVNWAKAVQGIPLGYTVTGLAAGGTHSLILANGKVYAAGSDRFGQLGQGGTNRVNRSSFIQVFGSPSDPVVAVSAGGNHSLALTEFGDVYACGDNTYGQLGNSTLVSSANWIKVSIQYPSTGLSPKIVSVVAGADHNLAVDEDGGVWVWGRNDSGQLGKNTRTLGAVADRTPVQIISSGAKSLAAGYAHSLILKQDGSVLGFGRNTLGQTGQSSGTSYAKLPIPIPGLSGIRLISAGTDSSFAIDGAGQLRSWGYNAYGELLLGYASPSSSPSVYGPTPSPIATNVFNVSGGGYSSLAVGAQGVIFGGRNDVGQSGNGPDPEQVVGDYYYEAGDLTLTHLTMDLAGTTETFYDQIFIGSGAATLNGIVNLMFVGSYTGPVYGTPQTFDLIWAKNGIVFGTGYQLAFNQAGYLVESAVIDKIVEGVSGKVLQATVRAVVTAADLAKAVDLASPSLDGVESVSYGVESNEAMGIRQLSVSPAPAVDMVEMIYSYKRPTGGVMSGAEYFVGGTTYRVEYSPYLNSIWNSVQVTGTTVTPLGGGYERATLRISASGSTGFLRLQVENPQATGINAGVGSAITY